MTNEVMAGFTWLEQTLSADSMLMSSVPGGIWRGLAPAGTATPFLILAHQTGRDITSAMGYRLYVEQLYQVKVVGPATEESTLIAAASRFDALLGGTTAGPASGSVAGAAILSCYRQTTLELDEIVSGELWTNIGGLYALQIEATS